MIKDRIISLRKEKNKLQSDLAAYLSCSLSTVSGYENGKPVPIEVIVKLADYYDVSADYLLCRTNERKALSGDLQEMLDRLARIVDNSFLTSTDIAALVNAIIRYHKNGSCIGLTPIDAVKYFVLGMTGVFNAVADKNVPMLIDQSNLALTSMLDVPKFISMYFEYINLFEPLSNEDRRDIAESLVAPK